MITLLNNLLRHVLLTAETGLNNAAQIGFQPPDESWRTYVFNLAANALNLYLVDLRENRKLRSNERVRTYDDGVVNEEQAPVRLDCHYLITAWSPAAVSPAVESTFDEHGLLYQAAAVLLGCIPFIPSHVYPPTSAPLLDWPERFRNKEIPLTVLPAEGFPKYAEFWGTMGQSHPWKPALYLVATLPIILQREIAGPLVTTRITEYRQGDNPGTAEIWIQIGGTARDKAGMALPNAWVQLETKASAPLQTTTTDTLGRFTFVNLRVGSYRLRVRATGIGERIRDIDVPSPNGEYDMRFL